MPNLVALSSAKRGGRLLTAVLTVWFALALLVSATGYFYGKPPPIVIGAVAALTVLCLLASWKLPSIHAWVKHTGLRVLVGYHLVRFVGIAFLVLHARGDLPGAFALTAGWGDIAVAVSALAVLIFAIPIQRWGQWWTVLAWNVFGLADILLVLSTAARLGLADAAVLRPMTAFPMSLVPTFLVPLILATHFLIFWRLWRTRRRLRHTR